MYIVFYSRLYCLHAVSKYASPSMHAHAITLICRGLLYTCGCEYVTVSNEMVILHQKIIMVPADSAKRAL